MSAPRRGAPTLAVVGLIAVGAAIRLWAALDDFWLDEVWSYFIARELDSPLAVFLPTQIQIDNNHLLNTLLLYALGDQRHWVLYRLPSVLAGTASLALAWVVLRRYGNRSALFGLTLFAFSYPLVHYASEARGYSLAVLFALASQWAGRRYLAAPTLAGAAAFWSFTALGMLAHPTFLVFGGALLVWLGVEVARRHLKPARAVLLLAPPLALAAGLWWLVLSRLVVVGAPPVALSRVLAATLSYASGGPDAGLAAALAAALAVAAVLLGLARVLRADLGEGVLWAVAIAAPPAAVLWSGADFAYPRYFLIALVFGLLAAAVALGEGWRRGGWARSAALLALAATIAGNGVHLVGFLRVGRGHYLDCVRFLEEIEPSDRIVVSGDDTFRNSMMLRFYARYLTPGSRLVYTAKEDLPPEGVAWLLVHYFEDGAAPPTVRDPRGNSYRLLRSFPYHGLSGFHWHVYARE